MKYLNLFLVFSILCFSTACGDSGDNQNDDSIAFLDSSSGELLQMSLDGEATSLFLGETEDSTPGKSKLLKEPWKDQKKILNGVCGKKNYSPDDEIYVFSPDGANLGILDDSWTPAWGPYGRKAAFACGTNENDNVVVVSNSEHSGESDDWSRSGSAFLSDRMEIIVTDRYGSSVTMLTNNNNGEWLPRWYPFNRVYALNETKFAKLGVGNFEEPIIFESNRNGESHIILMSTKSPNVIDVSLPKWHISVNFPKAQSPSWSKLGSAIAFNTGEENNFEIFLAFDTAGSSIRSTNQNGFPLISK
tara:strand:- start:27 stop:935 length:909 start_codon:yes stop_codon:yes gene_type:complete